MDALGNPFYEFALILILSAIAGAVGRYLKQPLIVAFIGVGIFLGPVGVNLVQSTEEVELLAEIGIAILLFVVGLKLDLNLIQTTGKVALLTGLGQVLFTSAVGYLIALALNFSSVHAIYIAVALTFSSTIIIVKMLSDKKEIDQLHGQISMGFLIVQDIVVIFTMILLAGFGETAGQKNIFWEVAFVLLKGFGFLICIGILMKFFIPFIIRRLAKNPELLVLASIAWAVLLAALGNWLGFSKEVGAFVGGISLASTKYREVISGRLLSIRDFLLLFFFINIGAQLNFSALGDQVVNAIIFSLFVLIGNPIIVMVIMGLLGYRKRTSFLAGLTVAQISEFSLILAALGRDLGHLETETVGLITLVGLLTIGISTYLILYSHPIYNFLSPILKVFEKRNNLKEVPIDHTQQSYDFIIIGLGRFGKNLADMLYGNNYKILVVDFNPSLLRKWEQRGIDTQYGDAEDPELHQLLPVYHTKNIVSTLSSLETNLKLVKFLKENGYKGKIIVTAHYRRHTEIYQKEGADEIIMPFVDASREVIKEFKHKLK